MAGCVYFTTSTSVAAYSPPSHTTLTQEYPVFSAGQDNTVLAGHLASLLHQSDETFAQDFEWGVYK